MDTTFREREHAARLEGIREGHREWERRERRSAERRAAEDLERTQQQHAEQQRHQEQQQAQQRVWGERLHALQYQRAALDSGISTANANAINAVASGDIEAAGDAQARALGLVHLRDRVEVDLTAHKRFG